MTHRRPPKRGAVVFEHLRDTGSLRAARGPTMAALRPKLPDSDGAPARAIAVEGEGA